MKWIALILVLVLSGCTKPAPDQTPQTASTVESMTALNITLTAGTGVWNDAESRWNVPVTVTYRNDSDEVFQLDKVTACHGGRIRNHVFDVRNGGAEVDYQGMMVKRAPPGPDGFWSIAPGGSESVEVDLGPTYAFPEAGGTFSVRFDHFNHFSKDDVQLTSEPISIVLSR